MKRTILSAALFFALILIFETSCLAGSYQVTVKNNRAPSTSWVDVCDIYVDYGDTVYKGYVTLAANSKSGETHSATITDPNCPMAVSAWCYEAGDPSRASRSRYCMNGTLVPENQACPKACESSSWSLTRSGSTGKPVLIKQ